MLIVISEKEIKTIKEIFQRIDTDNDGKINEKELFLGLKQIINKRNLEDICKQLMKIFLKI